MGILHSNLQPSGSTVEKIGAWLIDKATRGYGPFASSTHLAEEYLRDQKYPDNDARVDSLIRWETSKNAFSGFVTGLGGIITLPAGLTAGLAATYIYQLRMSGAIAEIYGHSVQEERTQVFMLGCLIGDSLQRALKEAGVKIGTRVTQNLIARIPGRLLAEINKRVGIRLLTKAGEKGVINLMKGVPLIGGVISGSFDAAMCRTVGKTAKKIFRPVMD